MRCELEGMDDLLKKLKKNVKLDDVKKVVKHNTAELQERAQRNCPVDTGNLKDSIGIDIIDDGMTGEVEPTADYGPYVEYGTRKMSAQPYVRPAFSTQSRQFKNDMDKLAR